MPFRRLLLQRFAQSKFMLRIALVGVTGLAFLPGDVLAQRREGYGRRSRSYDPAEMYRRMDDNNNGLIEPSEISDRWRPYIAKTAESANLNMNAPIPVSALVEAANKAREAGGGGYGQSGGSGYGSGGSSNTSGTASTGSTGSNSAGAPSSSGDRPAESSSSAAKTTQPAVAGFGGPASGAGTNKSIGFGGNSGSTAVATAGKPPAGFGAPGSSSGNSSGSGGSGSGSSSRPSGGPSEQIRRYAESLLRKYDANGNGSLEQDEWSKMSNDPQRSDTNGDGRITLEELIERLGNYGKRDSSSSSSTASTTTTTTSSSSPSSAGTPSASGPSGGVSGFGGRTGGSSSSSGPSGASSNSGLSSSSSPSTVGTGASGPSSAGPGSSGYGSRGRGESSANSASSSGARPRRFLTAVERLPAGLPSWFTQADADFDGQVMMSEYSKSWTEAKASEFLKLDLNGDGVITAQECLNAAKR